MTDVLPEPVKFLIVDDLEENILALEALLRRDDLMIMKATKGTQALEILLEHDIALAMLDVHMPNMDGLELAELMRGMERTKRVPIIFLTAASAEAPRRFRGYEAGAVDFLQKPVEPDILRSKANVFFELHRRQKLLELQRDRLEQADRRKDEFIAILAHELRNPLAPIKNGLEILTRTPDTPRASEIHTIMERQMGHLVRLIDDLLEASRMGQGKINIVREDTDLNDAVDAAMESCAGLIGEKSINVSLDRPDSPVFVHADRTRLSQIVTNLLNNAAKYTQAGGSIHIGTALERGEAKVTITDNGIGIDPAMMSHIFDLFTQIRPNGGSGGLGIGLSLVKRLTELHGGSVSAHSNGPGTGSSFTVRLPATERAAAPAPQNTVRSKAAEPLNILVVDDNIPSAQTIGWMLELIGHTAVIAHDAAGAMRIASGTSKPDVIVLDIGLPDMNGYDLCRELRKDPTLGKSVFIAQTGWGQDKDRKTAFEAGFDHHLVKPVSLQQFSEILADIKPRHKTA